MAEVLLWRELQGRKLYGWKFRRQQGIGKYIVDFCCPEAKLVVELDGAPHSTEFGAEKDRKRTEYLESQGFRVIRFENRSILKGMESVLEAIRDCLGAEKLPHPGPPRPLR